MIKLKELNLDLKEYLKFLEESNIVLKLEMANIKNSTETCETCVSLKKEVIDMH